MDRRQDRAWLEESVRNIPDAEALGALGIQSWDSWAQHWSEVVSSRALFADVDEFLAPRDIAARSLEARRDEILAEAERILRHEIRGWGDVVIQHGDIVNFAADYGENGVYGFHYWFWSRPLVWAFLLTGEWKYLDEFERLFNQWYEQRGEVKGRVQGYDPIWYELGLGLRNRVFLEFYTLAAQRCATETNARMIKTLLGAARWLCEEQKLANRLGNWQIMGCAGLARIGLMVSEFEEADEWARVAVQKLAWHLEKDFYPDGCHWERVPSDYMLTSYRDIRNVAVMLGEAGGKLREPLKRSEEFYRGIMTREGLVPGVNDGRRRKLPAVIAEAGAATESRCYPESGFTVLRGRELYMLINHGKKAGGHTHEDALSFEMHAFGHPIAVDAGIGLSYDDPHHSTWYRRAKAHNMVTVAGADPDRNVAAGEDVVFWSRDGIDYFAASHRGYEKSHGVVHRRHVMLVRGKYFLVYDELRGAKQPVEWNLHMPEPERLRVVAAPGAWKEARDKGLAEGNQIEWLRFEGNVEWFAVLLQPVERDAEEMRLELSGRTFVVTTSAGVERFAVPED